MNNIKKIENSSRYQNFIIFEPASLRIDDQDILLIGPDIKPFYDQLTEELLKGEMNLEKQILRNRLLKIGQMLNLVSNMNQVIVSRFFDRIWRRYSYISHLGEVFLDLDSFSKLNNDKKYEDADLTIANRYVLQDDEDDLDLDDSEDESEKTET